MRQRWLRCSDCEEQFFFPAISCAYWTGPDNVAPSIFLHENVINILTFPVWCHVCNQPSYAERIPSLREFEIAIAIATRKDVEDFFTADVNDDLVWYSVDTLKFLVQQLNLQRKGACLWCGGYRYTRVTDDCGNLIKLKHRFCSGNFYWPTVWPIITSHPNHRSVRWYDLNGKFMLEKCEQANQMAYYNLSLRV